MIHTLTTPLSSLATALRKLGIKEPVTVVLSSEDDGKALEKAIRGRFAVVHVPYDPKLGQVQRTATISSVKFVWPSADPSVELEQEEED
jgi:hypothetical protein